MSVFSVSVFASGTSTSPSYPNSSYTYVRGLSSSGSVYTGSATFFDAVTDSFVGIGNILGSMWTKLETIRTNTGYLSTIATHTDNLSTIKTYVDSGNTWLSKIYSDVASIKTSLSTGSGSGSSAWTSNQASTVTSNSTLIETNTRNISNKVATEATLKTLASESTVSSIKNILVSFETNLDTITTKVSDLVDVLASSEDKELHDISKPNLDYVNGDFSTNISDTDKFDTVNDSITGFGNIFGSSDLNISGIFSKAQENGSGFWSQEVDSELNLSLSRSGSVSSNGSCSLPYDPYENYNRIISRFSFGGD